MNFFAPTQTFNPEKDCHRPWEFELLERFVEELAESCQACAGYESDERTGDEDAQE